jgi:hypothetical protein
MSVRIIEMRLTKLLCAFVLTTASSVLASAAIAEPDPSSYGPIRLEPLSDTFNRAFFKDSGDFYNSRTYQGQFEYLFGPGVPGRASFPDLTIERDAARVNKLYTYALDLQVSSDPILRTPDLPNPFNTSLRQLPEYRRPGFQVEGSEFILPTLPPR